MALRSVPPAPPRLADVVVQKFAKQFDIIGIYQDRKSPRAQQGDRFSFVALKNASVRVEAFSIAAAALRRVHPEFELNWFPTVDILEGDCWPRRLLWIDENLDAGLESQLKACEHIDVEAVAKEVFVTKHGIDKIVRFVPAPDILRPQERGRLTLVLRASVGAPPPKLMADLEAAKRDFSFVLPEIVEVQAAPELNFPPTRPDINSDNDPWLEIIAEAMRAAAKIPTIEAVWFSSSEFPCLYILSSDTLTTRSTFERPADVQMIRYADSPDEVPMHAECIFNDITRLLKAEAEDDHTEASRVRKKIRDAASANTHRPPEDPAGALPPMDESKPETHFVPCRWCRARIPASSNPAHNNECPQCGAPQSAMMIPTKQPDWPIIAVFMNPDETAYLEVLSAVPKGQSPHRLDLCRVRRFTIPAQWAKVFDTNPMGFKDPQ